MSWHLQASTLREYVDDRTTASVAWSVETHVVGCARCRAVLARLLTAEDHVLLSAARTNIQLPTRSAPPRRAAWAVVEGVLGPWWVWLLLVGAGVGVVSLGGRLPVPTGPRTAGLTWLVALSPAVPVAMVAAVYAAADRDETTRTTSRGGLELVLYRTAAALLLALPGVITGLWMSGSVSVTWLLPGLGLCVGALALGSWVGVERAALGLCCAWLLLVIATMTPRSPVLAGGAGLIAPSGAGVASWSVAVVVAVAVLMTRLECFDAPGATR